MVGNKHTEIEILSTLILNRVLRHYSQVLLPRAIQAELEHLLRQELHFHAGYEYYPSAIINLKGIRTNSNMNIRLTRTKRTQVDMKIFSLQQVQKATYGKRPSGTHFGA